MRSSTSRLAWRTTAPILLVSRIAVGGLTASLSSIPFVPHILHAKALHPIMDLSRQDRYMVDCWREDARSLNPDIRAQKAAPGRFVFTIASSSQPLLEQFFRQSDVCLHGASIAQQCLQAGLLDEIRLHLVPILLGQGTRLFDQIGNKPIELERIEVIESPHVTHLRFRVVK